MKMRMWQEAELMYAHLFVGPQGQKTNTRYLNDLESNSRDIALSFTTATETRN